MQIRDLTGKLCSGELDRKALKQIEVGSLLQHKPVARDATVHSHGSLLKELWYKLSVHDPISIQSCACCIDDKRTAHSNACAPLLDLAVIVCALRVAASDPAYECCLPAGERVQNAARAAVAAGQGSLLLRQSFCSAQVPARLSARGSPAAERILHQRPCSGPHLHVCPSS